MTARKNDLSRRALLASSIPAAFALLLAARVDGTPWPMPEDAGESTGGPKAFTASASGILELPDTARSEATPT
ncbi:MAG: hypothetical protein AAGF23_27670 [Acidobacteriota bacterium]